MRGRCCIDRLLRSLAIAASGIVFSFGATWAAPPVFDRDDGEVVEPPHSPNWDDNLVGRGVRSGFDIHRHGFDFPNSWEDVQIDLPPPFHEMKIDTKRFGLCGGMIYAAHDSYYTESTSGRNVQTPHPGAVPGPGTSLRKYILDRQIDSLTRDGAGALQELVQWTDRRDATLRAMTWTVFTRDVAVANNKGWATPLMLVVAGNPTI